jgi:hypothetical protein
MKFQIKLLTFLILTVACSARAQNSLVVQLELSKESRGFNEHIRITADSVNVTKEDLKNGKPSISKGWKVAPEEWARLMEVVQSIKLKDLPALPAPSMKRASDAAMHATITVYTKDGKTYSHGYDDENPHPSLQELRKLIRNIGGAQ